MQKISRLRSLVTILLMTGILVGCGGGDGEDSGSSSGSSPTQPGDGGNPGTTEPSTETHAITGTLVAPEGTQAQATALVTARSVATSTTSAGNTCTTVPTSYKPISQATLSFTDEKGQALNTTLVTDSCGVFQGDVPDTAAEVTVKAAGYLSVTLSVVPFDASNQNDTSHVASLVPDQKDAGYNVASMQWNGEDLVFTVTDTITGKAVLGIPQSAVKYAVDGGASTDVSSLVYAAAQSGAASVVLALDASGSMMVSGVYDSANQPVVDANGSQLNMTRMAGLAAHAFLDGKSANDEVGIVVFDERAKWMDQSVFANAGLTSAGASYNSGYPTDGFTTDKDLLRLPVDYYNRFSKMWGDTLFDDLHSPLPADLRAQNTYPWGGGTAIYDAGQAALDKLVTRSNTRKVAVLMTDGADNESSITASQLTTAYKAKNIPLWTVSFGQSTNQSVLKQLADDTGGNYVSSTDTSQLASAFAAIQTGIVFQYVGNLGLSDAAFNAARGKNVTLTLNYGGLSASRVIAVPEAP